ncbi:hypothetical protein L1987_52910 [Smallanthus sonchifolius]|uniref:Uncharacterized protein n=1 Tax=Smallanthus sonchifolius TaxID=185202 RepID=A0ACB9EUK1_9ASTR|nr:hypothetical protein L1987_52910 [Smallanthus sonchifolius]
MSGGVGPSGDILLTQESKHEQHHPLAETRLHRGIFSFRQLNALAVAVVLSASGMVTLEDFAFVIFSFFYMYLLSKFAFPTLSPSHNHPVFNNNNRILMVYSFIGSGVGIFLPVAYVFEGVIEGDKEGIKAATPHVFLLASQFFLEGVAYSDQFSSPMRVLVMVVYNSARMFSLMEWVRCEMMKELHGSSRRLFVGRVLAVVNLVYWGFNLFGFLLPFYLPRVFKRYYLVGNVRLNINIIRYA